MTPSLRRTATRLVLGLSLCGCATAGSGPTGPAATPNAAPSAGTPDDVTRLDALLLETWKKAGVTPAPLADDGEYQRRVTLDVLGRPPRLEELRTFASDTAPDKRARLVDRLLADPEAGEHWADSEGDLLFGKEREKKIERYDPRGYLATAFNQSRPYDRQASELLTANGGLFENPATAFVITRLRGGGGPEAVAGATARIFLGLQIQCAQCHDHPYDQRWKQADFHGLVGYFARTKSRRAQGMMMDEKSFELVDQPRGEARMRAPGATADVVIKPKFLGRTLHGTSDEPRRQTLARAVVESDLFGKALVGRVWARLFGAAPLDPWDDLGAERDGKHPALLTLLSDDFRASGFELKRLVRRIVLSTAYQRSAAAAPGAPDDDGAAARLFARARLRPLTPEQLYRMVAVATGAEEMARARLRQRMAKEVASGEGVGTEGREMQVSRQAERTLREYRFAFDDDEMAADSDFDGTLPQALLLLNGELTNAGTRAAPGGVLAGILDATPDPAARVRQMFLAAYARPPTPEEAAAVVAALPEPARKGARKGAAAAYEDVFFALLTSTEAVTNH